VVLSHFHADHTAGQIGLFLMSATGEYFSGRAALIENGASRTRQPG